MNYISPSKIILDAIRQDSSFYSDKMIPMALGLLEPFGVTATESGRCAMCGLPIYPGHKHIALDLASGFVDDLSMACRGSNMVCANCGPLMTKPGIIVSGHGAFSSTEGYRPFRKWGEISELLLNPPTPPFVMVYATANNQHMAWRAPVNLSRDQFYVRVGLRDLKIRRSFLKAAADSAILLGKALESNFETKRIERLLKAGKTPKPADKPAPRKTLPNPYMKMDPEIKDVEHAVMHRDIPDIAKKDPQLSRALDCLLNVTLGESWALRFILTPGAGKSDSEQPENLT